MPEMPILNLVDENGKKISKEKLKRELCFLKKKILEMYKNIPEEGYQMQQEEDVPSLAELLLNHENAVDFNLVANTYNFYDRGIFITDCVDSEKIFPIIETIKIYNDLDEDENIPVEERNPIKLFINTPGGDLYSAFAIFDIIKSSKTPVHAYVIGSAFSAGFFIALACSKRYALPHASFLFHEGSCMDEGDAQKMVQRIEFYKKQLDTIREITLTNTKITEEDYNKHQKDDWFMDAQDALKYGIIDEIITSLDKD